MKKTLKMLSRLLSVVLTVLLLLEVMPLSTLAANLDEARQQQEYTESLLNNAAEEETPKKAEIECEVAEQRDEYTKVYKRADGSFTKLISSSPLHYMEDGVWEEINNTLKAYNGVLKNEAGAFNVELPSVIAANKSISIENDGDEISFKMNGVESSSASVSNNIGAAENGEALADSAIAKTSSSVVYEDIAQNTDLQYIVTPKAVKENIIINNKESAAQSYSFTVNKGTLTATADDNGNINFTDTDGTVKFTIPAPVMTDAAGAVSYDIAVTLTPANDSAVTLTYAPSSEWLSSAERAYPVAVDPVITVPSDDDELFSDTFVYYDTSDSESKDKNYVNAFVGFAANAHNSENNSDINGEILVKLNMNTFSAFKQPGVVVTDACYIAQGSGAGSNLQLRAINGAWEPSEITYNDVHPVTADPATGELPAPQITYDTTVTDYYNCSPTSGESSEYITFNFTELFNGWLSGARANNGFAIVNGTENVAAAMILGGSFTVGSNTHSYSTICLVDYTVAEGNDSRFESISQNIGRAGTANVNSYTRAMTISRNDLSMSGNIMPASIGFNYCSAYDTFMRAYTEVAGEELLSYYGNHWLPTYASLLFSLNDIQYTYYNAQGSAVTFTAKEDTTDNESRVVFVEEKEDTLGSSGYTLELIDQSADIMASNMVITNPNGEKETFDGNGFLTKICAAEANADGTYASVDIAYNENAGWNKIDSVTDGVGRKYVFNYTNDLLTSVVCKTAQGAAINAGSTETAMATAYSYDTNGNLTGVTYPDGETVNYTYNADGYISSARNIDGYRINYTYDSLGKVTALTEQAYDGSQYINGNTIALSSLDSCQTKLTDAQGTSTVYQFDSDGALLYTFDENGNYCQKSNYDLKLENNSIFSSGDWKISSHNLLKNPSFEAQSSISSSRAKYWNSEFTRLASEKALSGNYVYSLAVTTNSIHMQNQEVPVNGGNTYTFSANIKAQATGTMKLKVSLKNENTVLNSAEQVITAAVAANEEAEWEKYSVTVSCAGYEATSVDVSFGFDGTSGSFLVDDVQLEKGNGGAEYNYIENGSFNYTGTNDLSEWSGSDYTIAADTINGESVNAAKLGGGMAYYATDEGATAATLHDSITSITRNIPLNGKKDEIYSIGGWLKSYVVNNSIDETMLTALFGENQIALTDNRTVQIKINYSYTEVTDGVTETKTDEFSLPFQKGIDGWQFACNSFALKGDVTSVDVTLVSKNNPAEALFTGLQLCKEDEVIETAENEEDESETACICKCADCSFGEGCTCTGPTANVECTCPECQRKISVSTQDNFGNTTSDKAVDGTSYIGTTNSYSQDGNSLTSSTDENGNVTEYGYNNLNGILKTITQNSHTTTYLTTASGNVSNMSAQVKDYGSQNPVTQGVSYTYTHDRLTGINVDGEEYKITYDVWGQIISVSIKITSGNETSIYKNLVTYAYGTGAFRNRLNSVLYQNSSNASNLYEYYYDSTGMVTNIDLNNNVIHSYAYDNLGNLIEVNNSGSRTIKYLDNGMEIYDASDTLVYRLVEDESGNSTETNYQITYTNTVNDDDYNKQTGITSRSSSLAIGSTQFDMSQKTDWFGRKLSSGVTLCSLPADDSEPVSGAVVTSNYTYSTATDGKTSSRVAQMTNKVYNGIAENETNLTQNNTYSYEYDADNNITAEKATASSGTETIRYSYVYDELGQLVRCNDNIANKTYVYDYDTSGNILSKTEYAYTTDTVLGTAVNVTNYGYDAVWGDKLTRVNSQTDNILYDDIGNPTSYLGATLTWQGRQLMSYEKNGTRSEFEYDENGMRYRKRVYDLNNKLSCTFEYVWDNSKLISIVFTESNENEPDTMTIKYLYDDSGEVYGFIITKADGYFGKYLYTKNLQGDITSVVGSMGNALMYFSYDAWGDRTTTFVPNNIFGMLSALIPSLANPFGYRGYCYDSDLNLYYLQSRYYDPNTGRFINADSVDYLGATGTVLSYNLFAYCENNAVNCVDESGHSASSSSFNFPLAECISLVFFIDYILNGKKLKTVKQIQSNYDDSYFIFDIYYYKSKKNTNKFRVAFGCKNAWYSMLTFDKNLNVFYAEYFAGIVNEQMAKPGTSNDADQNPFDNSDGGGFDPYLVFTMNTALITTLASAGIKTSKIKKMYNKVWGKGGMDYKNKNGFCMFCVTKQHDLNGWYLFNPTTVKVKKI